MISAEIRSHMYIYFSMCHLVGENVCHREEIILSSFRG
jgi:hypothetical protein